MSVSSVASQMDVFAFYRSQLNALPDLQKKFNAFDRITSQELRSAAFEVLELVGRDPGLYEMCTSPEFTLGILGPVYIERVLIAIKRCKKLSDEMMSSLSGFEKKRLWSTCSQIETYIDSKIYQVLSRIVLAKNFVNSSNPGHPLHPIYDEMWKFQESNHGSACGCYTHIQTNLHFRIASPLKSFTKITQITVRCDVGSEDRLFIRGVGPGMSWDKGVELKNKGDGVWIFKTPEHFPHLEYKILLNDSQWEIGGNHKLERGQKEELTLNF